MNSRHPFRAVATGTEQPASPVEHQEQLSEAGEQDEAVAAPPEVWTDAAESVDLPPGPLARVMPALTFGAAALWTIFFVYAQRTRFSEGLTATEAVGLIGDWALPMVLIAVAWLLAMRSSAREAHRFGHVAASLEQQTRLLEDRLATVNRELGLARDFLSAETRELEFLGRSASERIGEHAGALQELIRGNGAQVEAIAAVSATALDNMNRLRQDLPVVAASARDMTNQIGNTGRGAGEQIELLAAEFDRMLIAARANEDQVESLKARTAETIDEAGASVDLLVATAEQRLAALRDGVEDYRRTMDVQEEEAMAAVKARTGRLGSELAAYHARLAEQEDAHLARLEQRLADTREHITTLHARIGEEAEQASQTGQQRLDAMHNLLRTLLAEVEQLEREADAGSHSRVSAIRENIANLDDVLTKREKRFSDAFAERQRIWDAEEESAASRLAERMAALDADVASRRKQEIAQTLILAEHSETIASRLNAAAERIDEVVALTNGAQDSLNAGMDDLTHRLGETRELIDEADAAVAGVAGSGVQLRELVRATASLVNTELLMNLGQAVEQLEQADARSAAFAATLDQASSRAERLGAEVSGIAERGGAAALDFTALRDKLSGSSDDQAAQLQAMRQELVAFEEDYVETTRRFAQSLRGVVDAARDDLAAAFQSQADEQNGQVAAFATRIGEQSAAAIATALGEHGIKAADELAGKMREAAEAGSGAVGDLRDQLARIHELTTNLEARIAQAREQSEESIDDDFSRRVALISERLNSTAIDLDKFLSTEVSETAWTSYLKGDRGIFTRRAVRLLDNREAREIVDIYNADGEFRGHVNRYLHDFEAMLRSLLSTRNGNALGVTILSSDVGKLYVALAQAIERLR